MAHPGSTEFNNEQLAEIIKLIWIVYFSNSDKFNFSPLRNLKFLDYDFIELEIISRIIDGFDCRLNKDIIDYYKNYCPIHQINYISWLEKCLNQHLSLGGKAAWYDDVRAVKLFKSDYKDAILIATYNSSLN